MAQSSIFSEKLSPPPSPLVVSIQLILLLGGGVGILLGLYMNSRILIVFAAIWTVSVILISSIWYRHISLAIRDDGIYFKRLIRTKHLPIEQVTAVQRDDGTAIDSHLITKDEHQETIWGGNKVVAHGSVPWETGTAVSRAGYIDRATDGFVRVDDTEGNIYLFATDQPEQLMNAIENARSTTT